VAAYSSMSDEVIADGGDGRYAGLAQLQAGKNIVLSVANDEGAHA
jgi:hypothetical protein